MVPVAESDAVVRCHSTSRCKYFTAVIKEYRSAKAGLITWVYYNSNRRILQEKNILSFIQDVFNYIWHAILTITKHPVQNFSQTYWQNRESLLLCNKGVGTPFILDKYHHKFTRTNILGEHMTIGEVAVVRTGLVTARKKKDASSLRTFEYRLLNLKFIANEGYI